MQMSIYAVVQHHLQWQIQGYVVPRVPVHHPKYYCKLLTTNSHPLVASSWGRG